MTEYDDCFQNVAARTPGVMRAKQAAARKACAALAPGANSGAGAGSGDGGAMPQNFPPRNPNELLARTQEESFVSLTNMFSNPGLRFYDPNGLMGRKVDPITPLLPAIADGAFDHKRTDVEKMFKGKLDDEGKFRKEVEDLFNDFRKRVDAGNQTMSSGVAGGPKKAYDVPGDARRELNQQDAGAFVKSLQGLSAEEKMDRLTVLKFLADHAQVSKSQMNNIGEQHAPQYRNYGGFVVGGRFPRGRNGVGVRIGR